MCPRVVKFLIKSGANVNCTYYNCSPLCRAFRYDAFKHDDIFEVLVRNGANLDKSEPTEQGNTVLHLACEVRIAI